MCDYSLQSVRSRPAVIGDHLVTRDFGTGTVGFAAADDSRCAVCLQPGTELSFSADVRARAKIDFLFWQRRAYAHRTALFRKINEGYHPTHHDALEFPDGARILLTRLYAGQTATVLQVPECLKGARADLLQLEAVHG